MHIATDVALAKVKLMNRSKQYKKRNKMIDQRNQLRKRNALVKGNLPIISENLPLQHDENLSKAIQKLSKGEWLEKKSKWLKRHNKRYFRLNDDGTALLYFRPEQMDRSDMVGEDENVSKPQEKQQKRLISLDSEKRAIRDERAVSLIGAHIYRKEKVEGTNKQWFELQANLPGTSPTEEVSCLGSLLGCGRVTMELNAPIEWIESLTILTNDLNEGERERKFIAEEMDEDVSVTCPSSCPFHEFNALFASLRFGNFAKKTIPVGKYHVNIVGVECGDFCICDSGFDLLPHERDSDSILTTYF
eukprot:g3787.t1